MEEKYTSELLEKAVQALSSLPGVGKRGALRLALHIMKQPEQNVHFLTESIDNLRNKAKFCSCCNMLSDNDICPICSDNTRDRSLLCIVENVSDVMSIENTGQYHGLYHVLGGRISPLDGIGPSDLSIDSLEERVSSEGFAEIIFALSGDVEGETTSLYIYRRLSSFPVKFSCLARGLGFGDNLEYADSFTLGRSIAGRQPFSKD